MVKSVLDPEIEYTDVMTIDKSDIGLDAVQFQLELFPNTAAVIALGNVKYTYSAKNILYVPVYLIKDGEVVDQIGVYEFLASNYTQLIDEDGDFYCIPTEFKKYMIDGFYSVKLIKND